MSGVKMTEYIIFVMPETNLKNKEIAADGYKWVGKNGDYKKVGEKGLFIINSIKMGVL